jgi:pyruvate dehydrogenase E2 component (dihydrolipoamide acetyltransferase)
MAHNVIMPKTGMAMEEGTIVRWLKQAGDRVSKGEAIAVIETDKVTMDLEAEYDGTLLAIVRAGGETVIATHTIAWIGEPGEPIPSAAAPAATAVVRPEPGPVEQQPTGGLTSAMAEGGRIPASPAARRLAAERGIPLAGIQGSGPGGAVLARDMQGHDIANARTVRATPLARRVAEASGVDLATVSGTGAAGRIRRADVESHASPRAASAGSRPLSGMRRVIAEKMLRSHQQVPSVTLFTRADITELVALRERLTAGGGSKISYTDFIVKAAATALRENPLINSVVESERIVFIDRVNIGVAVALEEGLVVPVIHDADTLTVRQIAERGRELARKARAGTLLPDEYAGGTFTITNLGMLGITEFTPLINVPESAILGVGAIEEGFKTIEGKGIQSRRVLSLCLTHDHRHIDGAPAAIFLGRVRALLEDGYALLA